MNSSKPLVSVIVPVYNGEDFLVDALASIRQQDYCPLEIVIVNDGSTDGTVELAATLGQDINWIQQQNNGPSAARNAGLATARGEFIAFLDADDLWPPGKLQAQVELLLQPYCRNRSGAYSVYRSFGNSTIRSGRFGGICFRHTLG